MEEPLRASKILLARARTPSKRESTCRPYQGTINTYNTTQTQTMNMKIAMTVAGRTNQRHDPTPS